MTKADLVTRVYERLETSKIEVSTAVDEVFAIIRECLGRGERVKISGFGSFAVTCKRARPGRNPRTGEAITIGSRAVLSFRPSGTLKSEIAIEGKPR